jgi:hypothetical protein
MDTTPANSTNGQPYEAPVKTKEKNTKSHYRRRSLDFSGFSDDLDQDFQVYYFKLYKSYTDNIQILSGGEDQESIIPENQRQDRPLPVRKDQIKKSNKDEMDKERDREKIKDDENIIEDPTGGLDDPYKPGHADRQKFPPIEEDTEIDDPERNTETHE